MNLSGGWSCAVGWPQNLCDMKGPSLEFNVTGKFTSHLLPAFTVIITSGMTGKLLFVTGAENISPSFWSLVSAGKLSVIFKM